MNIPRFSGVYKFTSIDEPRTLGLVEGALANNKDVKIISIETASNGHSDLIFDVPNSRDKVYERLIHGTCIAHKMTRIADSERK